MMNNLLTSTLSLCSAYSSFESSLESSIYQSCLSESFEDAKNISNETLIKTNAIKTDDNSNKGSTFAKELYGSICNKNIFVSNPITNNKSKEKNLVEEIELKYVGASSRENYREAAERIVENLTINRSSFSLLANHKKLISNAIDIYLLNYLYEDSADKSKAHSHFTSATKSLKIFKDYIVNGGDCEFKAKDEQTKSLLLTIDRSMELLKLVEKSAKRSGENSVEGKNTLENEKDFMIQIEGAIYLLTKELKPFITDKISLSETSLYGSIKKFGNGIVVIAREAWTLIKNLFCQYNIKFAAPAVAMVLAIVAAVGATAVFAPAIAPIVGVGAFALIISSMGLIYYDSKRQEGHISSVTTLGEAIKEMQKLTGYDIEEIIGLIENAENIDGEMMANK